MAVTSATSSPDVLPRFQGLSADSKPDSQPVGAKFLETDTRKEFIYSGTDWVRIGLTTVEQAEAIAVKPLLDTDTLLVEILAELRINNAHLALVTGDEIHEEDIDASN